MSTWPDSGNFVTTSLDAGADSPKNARVALYQMALDLIDVIGSRGAADGVASLDATGLIIETELPVVPVDKGGTGATTAAAARAALSVDESWGYTPVNKAGDTMTGNLTVDVVDDTDYPIITAQKSADTADGPMIYLLHARETPAENDSVGLISFVGYDSSGYQAQYGRIETILVDPTYGSTDSKMILSVQSAGTGVFANYSQVLQINGTGIDITTGPTGASAGTLSLGGVLTINASHEGFFNDVTIGTAGGACKQIKFNCLDYPAIYSTIRNQPGGALAITSGTYLWLVTAAGSDAIIDAGGYFYVRDKDGSNANRFSVDTATGNVWAQGDATFGTDGGGARQITLYSYTAGDYGTIKSDTNWLTITALGQNLGLIASSYISIQAGAGSDLYMKVGGILRVQDRDASGADRVMIDSATGAINCGIGTGGFSVNNTERISNAGIFKLTPTADFPTSPSAGWICAKTDGHVYYYSGSAWKQLDN